MVAVLTYLDRLQEVAATQHGYVTAAQALDAGVPRAALGMLAHRERIDRETYGVFRIPQVPETQYSPFMAAILWTGCNDACLSHDTALAAWQISDINPTAIHLTVPRQRRIRRGGGQGYVLHHEDLTANQIGWWQGIPTVGVSTAIRQCITSGVSTYLLRQAITNAAHPGGLRPHDQVELTAILEARDARE